MTNIQDLWTNEQFAKVCQKLALTSGSTSENAAESLEFLIMKLNNDSRIKASDIEAVAQILNEE